MKGGGGGGVGGESPCEDQAIQSPRRRTDSWNNGKAPAADLTEFDTAFQIGELCDALIAFAVSRDRAIQWEWYLFSGVLYIYMCVCVCVCVREREREREFDYMKHNTLWR